MHRGFSSSGAVFVLIAALPITGAAQSTPTKLQSSSSITASAQSIEIHNVTYDVTSSGTPGRPHNERLLLRKTVHSKEIIGDIDVDAKVTMEAWPLGSDVRQKPLYTVSETGTAAQIVEADFFVVDRRLEEVPWWTVHKLGNGQRLFDTYAPLVSFSIARDTVTMRYAGLEIPLDDSKDKRLTESHVVAVVTYASAEKILREALVTCDDPKRAILLRSLADSTQALTDVSTPANTARDKNAAPGHALRLSIEQNYPSPPNPVEISIPIVADDLDLAHAKLPPGIHVAPWKR